jgi:hypothetical protein
MDFGLAKRGSSELTQTGAVMGTPAYMAPEQARGETKTIGPAADIYSLGVILYECLCGSVPFTGSDAWSVIRQVVSEEPEPVTRRIPGIPRELDLVCRKCLAKEPAERYESAAALADDLQRFLNGEDLRGARTGVWHTSRKLARRWARRWPAVVGLLLAVLATWVIASNRWKPTPPPEAPIADRKPDENENEMTAALRQEVTNQVAAVRRTKPHPDHESPHPVTTLPELPAPDFSCFKATRDERVVDMRGWRPAAAGAESFVIFTNRREFTKSAPADELRIETRTTGRAVVNHVLRPNPGKARVLATDTPAFVGNQPTKVQHIVFDVSDVAVDGEFTLRFTSTHWDVFQTDADRWTGVTGYPGAVKMSMLLLFPEGHPFHTCEFRDAPTRGKDTAGARPYTGPLLTFAAEDKSWLYWEIPSPKQGHFYRVDWTW